MSWTNCIGRNFSLRSHFQMAIPAGVKPMEFESDHSPAPSSQVKNLWSSTSISHILHHIRKYFTTPFAEVGVVERLRRLIFRCKYRN
jgi:hypothetical protein